MTILFDFDGVILNSRENMRLAWTRVQDEFGVTAPFESYFEQIGKPFQVILDVLGIERDRERIEHTYFSASSQHADKLRLFPGMKDALVALASLRTPLGILTSKDPVRTRQFVYQFGLPVNYLYCPTPDRKGKPAPDLFHLAAREWGCEPGDITYIGDMAVDEQAARGFGARYIHVEWGYGRPMTEFAPRVTSPDEMLDILIRRHAPALAPFLARHTVSVDAHRYATASY